MGDIIVVLNAGSSSLKFTIYRSGDEKPQPLADGQTEGLFTEPYFKVKDGAGKVIGEKRWPPGTKLGHEGAVETLFQWGRENLSGSNDRIVAVGHRVVHGGLEYTKPTVVNNQILEDGKFGPQTLEALKCFIRECDGDRPVKEPVDEPVDKPVESSEKEK